MSRISRYQPCIVLFTLMVLLLSACNMPRGDGAEEPATIHTVAAMTLQAELTEEAAGDPDQPDNEPDAEPSDTPEPTNTLLPTNTPLPTNTLIPTATPIPCDHVDFGEKIDVTIPDGTEIEPGETFTKTWRLENGGTCTWTSGYELVFVRGDQMGAPPEKQLTTGTVAPGELIDVSVELVAPADPGNYRGYFKLRNTEGVLFGWGDQNKPFWVDIVVPDVEGVTFDFIARADEADWGTGTTPIDFAGPGHLAISYGGPDSDSDGFAMVKDNVVLEDGKKSGKILETHPKWENDGYIIGRYPLYRVVGGDRLKGRMGFITLSDGSCGVGEAEFRIYYTIGDDMGTRTELGSWNETCDGSMEKINIDLNFLKGKEVHFYLAVLAKGSSSQDWAVWDSLGVIR
jgi:hypothetical protein